MHAARKRLIPPKRDDKVQNLSGHGGDAAFEKVPGALIRGDHTEHVRQRGADSRAGVDEEVDCT